MLAPGVTLAVHLDRLRRLSPACDRREDLPGPRVVLLPEVDQYRNTGRPELDAVGERHAAARLADVLAPAEGRGVLREEVERDWVVLGQPNLERNRISVDEHEPAGLDMVRQRNRPPVKVEDQVGVAVEPS